MRNFVLTLASFCLVFLFQPEFVAADLIFSQTDSDVNGAGNQTFNAGGASSTWEAGDDFVLGKDAMLTSIQWAGGLADTPSTRLRIYETASGVPLATPIYDVSAGITNVSSLGSSGFLKQMNIAGPGLELEAGLRYWWTIEYFAIDAGVKGYVDGAGGGTNHTFAHSDNDGASWTLRAYNTYFTLSGTTAVPEPGLTLIPALFLATLGLRRRTR